MSAHVFSKRGSCSSWRRWPRTMLQLQPSFKTTSVFSVSCHSVAKVFPTLKKMPEPGDK